MIWENLSLDKGIWAWVGWRGTYVQAIIINFTIELENAVQGHNLNLGLLHSRVCGNGWALKKWAWSSKNRGLWNQYFFCFISYSCVYLHIFKLFKSNMIIVRNSDHCKVYKEKQPPFSVFSFLCALPEIFCTDIHFPFLPKWK